MVQFYSIPVQNSPSTAKLRSLSSNYVDNILEDRDGNLVVILDSFDFFIKYTTFHFLLTFFGQAISG